MEDGMFDLDKISHANRWINDFTNAELERWETLAKDLNRSAPPEGKTCLDIGCGFGLLAASLIENGAELVTGVEYETDTVCPQILVDERFELIENCVTACHLPIVDQTYCLGVLHNILAERGWLAMHETMRRILRTAPVVFIEVPSILEEPAPWSKIVEERFSTQLDWEKCLFDNPLIASREEAAQTKIHGSHRTVYKIRTERSR